MFALFTLFSSERILSAGLSLFTESKPCAVVQSLAAFHLEWLKKNVRSSYSVIPHQAEGVLPFPCNPKPTSISWMQVFAGWLTVKRAQHWAHLSIAECVQFRCRAKAVLAGAPVTERKDSPAIHAVCGSLIYELWGCGIFLHNLTEGSLWISQLNFIELTASRLHLAVTFCLLIFYKIVDISILFPTKDVKMNKKLRYYYLHMVFIIRHLRELT